MLSRRWRWRVETYTRTHLSACSVATTARHQLSSQSPEIYRRYYKKTCWPFFPDTVYIVNDIDLMFSADYFHILYGYLIDFVFEIRSSKMNSVLMHRTRVKFSYVFYYWTLFCDLGVFIHQQLPLVTVDRTFSVTVTVDLSHTGVWLAYWLMCKLRTGFCNEISYEQRGTGARCSQHKQIRGQTHTNQTQWHSKPF